MNGKREDTNCSVTMQTTENVSPLSSFVVSLGKLGGVIGPGTHKDSWLCAGGIWLIFLFGSFAHDFVDVPPSYFSDKRNFLNVWFVKIGWGWTLGVLLVYTATILVLDYSWTRKLHLSAFVRLALLTLVWFFATRFFLFIEAMTGECKDSVHTDRDTCELGGHLWSGFDISGHSFMLSFLILIINEELQDIKSLYMFIVNKFSKEKAGKETSEFSFEFCLLLVSEISGLFLQILKFLWAFMLFWTCLYFHTITQKLFGIIFGIGSWFICYEQVFKSLGITGADSALRSLLLNSSKS